MSLGSQIERESVPCWMRDQYDDIHLFVVPMRWPFVAACGYNLPRHATRIDSTVYPPYSPDAYCKECLRVYPERRKEN